MTWKNNVCTALKTSENNGPLHDKGIVNVIRKHTNSASPEAKIITNIWEKNKSPPSHKTKGQPTRI